MTRPRLLLVFTVLGLSIALLYWVLKKMVSDKRRRAFPTELPDRPPKLTLAQHASQRFGFSVDTLWGAENVSPSFSNRQWRLSALTPSTSVTNTEGTRSFQPHVAPAISNLHGTARVSPHNRQKTSTSNLDGNNKDSFVERFEKLKSRWNGKSHSQSSSVPDKLPPLSLSNTIPSPNPAKSRHPSLQTAKQIWNKMAGSNTTERKPLEIPPTHRSGDFTQRPHITLAVGSKYKHPILIDDSDDESDSYSVSKRYWKTVQRGVRTNDRMPPFLRRRKTSTAQHVRRRSRSPNISDRGSGEDLTPTSSQDVSYPDLSAHFIRQSPTSERSEAHALSKTDASIHQEELDRQLAERLQRDEVEKHRRAQKLYVKLETAADQPSRSSTAMHTRQDIHQRVRLTATGHQGSRDDPIDLDTETSSDSDNPVGLVFGNRIGVWKKEAASMNIDEEGWNPCAALDAINTTIDAMMARDLQKGEEHSQRAAVATRTCVVCDNNHPISDLPSLAECGHHPQTCVLCYSEWVAAQLEGSGWREAKCPEDKCQTTLTYHEIQQFATSDTFKQYDTFIARAAMSEDRKFKYPNARFTPLRAS
jgi:hypothetical protein